MNIKYAYGILFRDKTEKAWSIGILEFRPKVELGDLKFGEQKLLLHISPPILNSRSQKFLGP